MKAMTKRFVMGLLAAGALQSAPALALDSALPWEEYNQLPNAEKSTYEKELRAAFAEFELGTQENIKYTDAALDEQNRFWNLFFPEAQAQAVKSCLIGGVSRPMKQVTNLEGYFCPVKGRGCGSWPDGGYLCGVIYNDSCIALEPANTITRRCIGAAGDALPSQSRYNAKRDALASVAVDCREGNVDSRYQKQCDNFIARLNRLNNGEVAKTVIPPERSTIVTTKRPATEAPAVPEVEKPGAGESLAAGAGGNNPDPEPPVRGKGKPHPGPGPGGKNPSRTVHDGKPASNDCMSRNRAKLGSLACVACGMENAAPAGIRNNGGGVSNWVALVGVMAQQSYGPFNVNDEVSRGNYQQRVAEMVSSYGYCTDREYPATPGNDTRNYIDGQQMSPAAQSEFAQNFGLMSNKHGFFSSRPENSNRPMVYANECFNERSTWDNANVQGRQWRFRSMLKAQRQSYPGTAFSQCAAAVDNRLQTASAFKMCPIRQKAGASGGMHYDYPDKIGERELANNEAFYKSVASACGIKKPRKQPNTNCDNACWYSGAYKNASATLGGCNLTPPKDHGDGHHGDGPKGGEPSTNRSPPDNTGKGAEPSTGRSAPSGGGDTAKGGEPSTSRSSDGASGGGATSGGDTGSTGKGAEGGNSVR